MNNLVITEEQLVEKFKESDSYDLLDYLMTKKPRVARAVQLYLTGAHTIPKIADLLEVRPETIRRWLKDPDIKGYMDEYQKENALLVRTKLFSASNKALDTMIELLDDPIGGNRIQAARDLMDRAGFKPEQKVKKEVTVTTIEQQLNDLIEKTIDVDYEEVD